MKRKSRINKIILCACGCGKKILSIDKKGRERHFAKGHNNREENKRNWKGNCVGYRGLHAWVCRRLGSPQCCNLCGTTEKRKYHWGNKSGKYKREITDWIRMCVPCHSHYDKSLPIVKKL